ncbi:MAG: DUF1674 domain-containing protein [Alphaproteobacteria bacterium]|nr:DUF1674 domain-containing protein [Alphaproteobacteria bacterium]
MTNEKPTQQNSDTPKDESAKKNLEETKEERGGFGEKGNGKPEPTRYNDWEVDGRCSDF